MADRRGEIDQAAVLGESLLAIRSRQRHVDTGARLRRTGDPKRKGQAFEVSEQGDCELEDYEIKTMEALKLDAAEINRKYKVRTRRSRATNAI